MDVRADCKGILAGVPTATAEDILDVFRRVGALLEGHFRLTSGLHSPGYLQCALVLQHPAIAELLGAELAAKAKADPNIGRIDLVVAPALGGVIVAHEVARALGVRALFTERQEKTMTLRRGFQIGPGERCLVVEDVVTTGGSTREVMEVVWSGGESTVRRVQAALPRPVAYTTVMTTLDRLFKKGFVTRTRVGRAFLYCAAHTREQTEAAVASGMVSGLFSSGAAVPINANAA